MRPAFRRMVLMTLIVGLGRFTQAGSAGPLRFHSPSNRFDLVVETLPNDWTHAQKEKPGMCLAARDQYALFLYVRGSSEPVNVIYYADSDPAPSAEEVIKSIQWSPQEEFLVLPDRQKARQNNHVFLLAAPTYKNKAWGLEANHVHWIDGSRFVGDHRTKEIPGAIMMFIGQEGKAELLIQPTAGIGYEIASVEGPQVTVREFLNHLDTGKTTWASFTPACFTLDANSLMKRSVPCPKDDR